MAESRESDQDNGVAEPEVAGPIDGARGHALGVCGQDHPASAELHKGLMLFATTLRLAARVGRLHRPAFARRRLLRGWSL